MIVTKRPTQTLAGSAQNRFQSNTYTVPTADGPTPLDAPADPNLRLAFETSG